MWPGGEQGSTAPAFSIRPARGEQGAAESACSIRPAVQRFHLATPPPMKMETRYNITGVGFVLR